MSKEPFGLLELGSNSLKFYLVLPQPDGRHTVETHKRPWRVAHEFFERGRLSPEAVDDVLEALRSVESVARGVPLSTMLAVATGVFREIAELHDIEERAQAAVGLRIRLISGEEEASLMARSIPREQRQGSLLVCDLGGATTEWTWFQDGTARVSRSQPLGAIRNAYAFRALRDRPDEYLGRSATFCDERLREIPVLGDGYVLATGGTAQALARCHGRPRITVEELRAHIRDVLHGGAPECLSPDRGAVFLPGLIIFERILSRCGASILECTEISVRDGLARRLIRLLASHRRSGLHATLLLRTSQT